MKKPKVGDVVAATWVDSGAEAHGQATLDIATTYGRVLSLAPCPKIKAASPRGFPCEVLTLEMCSSFPTHGLLLWRDVIKIEILSTGAG